MTRDQAHTLIGQTLGQAFNKERFRAFALNLLNHVDEAKAQTWNSQYVKAAFRDHVNRYERLGTYTSPEGEKVDVLIVHLTTSSKLERARTAIRNFVADHLKTRDEKDAALVAFVSPTDTQWRLSYVKMEYATVEKEPGKVGVEARLTPARRCSYIVGEGESCHTAQTRFLELLQDTEVDPELAAIEEAFSVEAVTKEFFTKYAELFDGIRKALDRLADKDKTIRDEFEKKNVNSVDFAKKLMGQVVFLYFLQKKGWLGVAKGQDWGTGPHDFLRKLARGDFGKYDNLFNDVLEPLFYDTLATDRGHEAWCDRFKCRIPFLNGGLFEPLEDYDWRTTDIMLPNELFTNGSFIEEGITGTGVLDVFDRYNFTVNEAEPLEKEVAIDPEMLGKVFENLIEENRRKGLGAYYTPREIVHYMCQESLINHLDTALNKDKELVARGTLETFVHLGEQISYYEAVDAQYAIKMPKGIEAYARLIDDKLADITVCDPAVGSGAFPVGMMTEIVRARCALTPYFNDVQERTPYYFKRLAIQNCLYGVDIDAGAVEIARLRLWLSLVVDEDDVQQIKPLPNLDYKIVVGNSLLGFPFKSQGVQRIERLKDDYFGETDHNEKMRLKHEIDAELSKAFASSKSALGYEVNFDFAICFSEIFREGGGFDVIIANPPYVGESGHKELFRKTREGPLGEFYFGKMDYFYFFLHLALNLARADGEIAFITTNYYLTATGARKLRADFKRRALIRRVISFNELKIFESAQGQHNMVSLLRRGIGDDKAHTCITDRTGLATPDVLGRILRWSDTGSHYYDVAQAELYDGPENYIRLTREHAARGGGTKSINSVLDKVAAQGEVLGKIANINQGVVSGCDYVSSRNEERLRSSTRAVHGDGIFVFDLNNPRDKAVVNSFSATEQRLLRRFYKNSDIDRYWCSTRTSKRLLYIGRDLDSLRDYPKILAHLRKFEPVLSERREVKNGRIEFFQLQWPRSEGLFTGAKIVVPYRSEENAFAYTATEWFCRSDCYVITQGRASYALGYLLALLNSSLYFQWLFHRGKRKGRMLEMFQIPLSEVPIKPISDAEQKQFVDLTDRIVAAKCQDREADTKALEQTIDEKIFDLFCLSNDEREIILRPVNV